MLLSIVIPAFDEESYLPETLSRLRDAMAECPCSVEIVVVDNGSTDRTAEIARFYGTTVVGEPEHNIARVRNAGAGTARGDVLVFVDADTAVPRHFLRRIAEATANPACMGGRVEIAHTPTSRLLQGYLQAWRWLAMKLAMAQGAAQFCRKEAFGKLAGYDESQFMGEDVDFYWRLRKLCARNGGHLKFLEDVRVVPSPRRFEQAPLWRTLIWTNPLFIALFRKTRWAWAEWYEKPYRCKGSSTHGGVA